MRTFLDNTTICTAVVGITMVSFDFSKKTAVICNGYTWWVGAGEGMARSLLYHVIPCKGKPLPWVGKNACIVGYEKNELRSECKVTYFIFNLS